MYESPMSCGHTFTSKVSPPQVGKIVYCRRCADYQFVNYDSSHWKTKCLDCSYARYLGADEKWAEGKAKKHAYKYVGHRLKLFRARTPDTWRIITASQEALPVGASDEPPF